MTWDLKGLVIKPTGDWWCRTHCMMPTPEHIGGPVYRIYFGGRNDKNQSHIGFADYDLDKLEVMGYSPEPVLSPGPLGRFDDNGVLPSCIQGNRIHYIGFKPGGTTRMQLLSGVACRGDVVFGEGYITGENHFGISTAPWACDERMYYVAGLGWDAPDEPRYHIALHRYGRGAPDCVIPLAANENALARPYVVKEDGLYKMFFSAKGEKYRPQYAESPDGLSWERKPYDFPEEFMCYMIVLKHNGREYMLYNDAENYGRDGIKLAVRGG